MNERILKTIETIVSHFLQDAKFDKTIPSVILEVNGNNTYTIMKDGQKYKVTNSLGTELSVGQSVWVKIPCGRLHCMHICGLR